MTDVERSEAGSGKNAGEIVLITGASGFIAAALIARLGERYTVVGLDRAGPPDPPPPASAVNFDLGSDAAVRTALDEVRARHGNRIASVIHLAAYYDITGEPNPLYDKITVQGTRRLIDGLQSFEVEQFVFASTMLVHKPTPTPDERINEDSPIAPAWAYPQSKVDTEVMLHERRGKIPVVYLRPAGVYDDGGRSAVLAQQIARIYEHRLTAHFYPGMLCAAQSSVHRDDLADAVLRPDIQTRYDAYRLARQGGWVTANEIREKENLPPHAQGDELQVTPVGGAPNEPGPSPNGKVPTPTPPAGVSS